jgi:hypothetical protein
MSFVMGRTEVSAGVGFDVLVDWDVGFLVWFDETVAIWSGRGHV